MIDKNFRQKKNFSRETETRRFEVKFGNPSISLIRVLIFPTYANPDPLVCIRSVILEISERDEERIGKKGILYRFWKRGPRSLVQTYKPRDQIRLTSVYESVDTCPSG